MHIAVSPVEHQLTESVILIAQSVNGSSSGFDLGACGWCCSLHTHHFLPRLPHGSYLPHWMSRCCIVVWLHWNVRQLHTALSIGTTTDRHIASLNVGCIVPQLVKRAGVLLFEQCPICPTAVFV